MAVVSIGSSKRPSSKGHRPPPRFVPGKKISCRERAIIFVPYVWMILFFLIPFLIIFKISFSITEISIPPYSPIITFEEGAMQIILHLENYTNIFTDPDGTYLRSYLKSIQVAAFSTLFCLIIGYPKIGRASCRERV